MGISSTRERLTGSDGEVIFLDGKAYHANEHKEFIRIKRR